LTNNSIGMLWDMIANVSAKSSSETGDFFTLTIGLDRDFSGPYAIRSLGPYATMPDSLLRKRWCDYREI